MCCHTERVKRDRRGYAHDPNARERLGTSGNCERRDADDNDGPKAPAVNPQPAGWSEIRRQPSDEQEGRPKRKKRQKHREVEVIVEDANLVRRE